MADHAFSEDVKVAESYYDSPDADQFYAEVWGGEDIHIGLYASPDEDISIASRRTVERMAGLLGDKASQARVLDLGAGYGGAARWLAREKGCHVTCVNISEAQNAANRAKTAEQGLSEQVDVRHGSFDAPPVEAGSFDVVWSQDAFLHGADRQRIISAAAEALAPGGRLIFTDPMQTETASAEALSSILERIHLPSLGSVGFYQEAADKMGLVDQGFEDHSTYLGMHYARVRDVLSERREALSARISPDYIDRMIAGLGHWVDGQARGDLCWGVLHFAKPDAA